ncbi:uncharacterized protein SPSC_06081 [Sporisorium scitamineum]|uniref:Uncharacterized protein n=1 Tax=Sporisorium scitamineum TaxID=49012 RepID=A0A0F7RWQ6_9BASI|nr:hypothetical protein [Sporisorium scitamineum]CDU25910.1 uncharacterized protein SPSC_06081 [Sporisorium scitamineum]
MSHSHTERSRTASPGIKQVAFNHKCQVIPEGDCAELRKLLSLNPTRAQSPPIVGSSRPSSFIARAISPQLVRAKSPNLKKLSGLGNAAPAAFTSWRTRLASWGSGNGSAGSSAEISNHSNNSVDGNISAAFGPSAPSTSSNDITTNSSDGPRLVAPIAARGTPSLMIPFNDDDESVEISPSNESVIDFDDVDAEFQHAVSGAARRQSITYATSIQASPSPTLEPPRSASPVIRSASPLVRSASPFVCSVSELRYQRPMSGGRPKSCLVRSSTPQAPGPPRLMDDGMSPLRATRSHDRDGCFPQRRRADGVPVVCSSPLSSPRDEQGAPGCSTIAGGSRSAKHQTPVTEKPKLSRWRRFRRTASKDAPGFEPSSSTTSWSEMRLDDPSIKRQIQAGRWPFEAPLNTECSCKNCQDRIEVGLASNYEPRWTRAARIRWLEGQQEAASQTKGTGSSSAGAGLNLPRSTSRTAIQADEVAQLHNETVHPMTAAELAHEPASPAVEQSDPLPLTVKPPNPTGLEEGDDTLRREILARRQKAARQSPVLRHGARSMMRQIEEAERREKEAARARSVSREGHRESRAGSGRSSPSVSPAMSPSTPSTSHTVSTPPQDSPAAASSSYFDPCPAPPERVRSPLIPAGVALKSRYLNPIATDVADSPTMTLAGVAQSLEALASPAASPASWRAC